MRNLIGRPASCSWLGLCCCLRGSAADVDVDVDVDAKAGVGGAARPWRRREAAIVSPESGLGERDARSHLLLLAGKSRRFCCGLTHNHRAMIANDVRPVIDDELARAPLPTGPGESRKTGALSGGASWQPQKWANLARFCTYNPPTALAKAPVAPRWSSDAKTLTLRWLPSICGRASSWQICVR